MPRFIPVDFDPFSGEHEIEKLTFTNEPQREIWLACAIGGRDANLSYNESVSLKIIGDLNFNALKKAVGNLVLRHEALRATVSPNGETLIIYKDFPVAFDLADISQLNEPARKQEFNIFLRREMDTPMSLQEGPLFRAFLHKTSEQEYCFTIIKHHIISDGWSTGIMLEDISKMYNAYAKGEDISLDLPSQISDYSSAQASFKLTKAYKQTEDHWLGLYKDNVPVLDLPTDNPRRAPRSYNGNRVDRPLSKEMVKDLKAMGAKAGCSLVTTLLAAFEVFLYSETRQRDIVVGLPSSGQAASGLTDVVGHCVNLLPLRSHIDPAASFKDYLIKRKREVLDAYDHQRLTFGELIKKLYIPRDPSRIPLVPVMFNIDMGMDNSVYFEGLHHTLISNPRAYENFEIFLNATGSEEGIILEWSYNTGLFKDETIESFNDEYQSILRRIISDQGATISDLAGTGKHPMSFVSGNEVDIAAGQNIITLFDGAVKQYPGKTAISCNNVSITYQQLAEKADALSSFLIQNGIEAGDIVALCVERSVEMVVCLLAVLKAGAVYLPLDPEYPAERINFMLSDSSAKLLLTSAKYKNRFRASVREIAIEDIPTRPDKSENQLSQNVIQGNGLAYIIYTSGSTGTPKGVKITHGNLVNFLTSMQAIPGIKDSDRLLAITSISFDIAGLELYLPLISGAEIVLADSETVKDGRALLNLVEEKNISIMQATPSTWQMMLDSGWQRRFPVKILSGGEALPEALADKLLDLGAELWNMYGPTETTIWSTVKQVFPGYEQLTIGIPVNNTHIYILGEYGQPMPVNHSGEIYIGGEGVAEGYLNRPELTAEKFIPDPYSKKPGARIYKTGDTGKILDNGEILYSGRADDQVKIRGHRIEPGEIEANILKQDGVKQCVVLAREDVPGDKRLVAYITRDGHPDTGNNPSWKDSWDILYGIGAEGKKNATDHQNIDGTLLEHLQNSEELTTQAAEWLHTSVERIKELNAKRIYEIGCGAGQVLFELAAGTEYYMATDYAQEAIDNINKRLKAEPGKWAQVKAGVATADDFSTIKDTPVDLVLINSVVQYFPDADYLIRVIKQAVNAVQKGGYIFIGDMQGKNTLEMYHAMDHLPRASDTTTLQAFKEVVANRVRIEEEFVADPAFFYLLPGLIPQITGVDIQLRKGHSLNETTKYHYDVWLYVSTPVDVVKAQVTRDWKDVHSIEMLEQLLMDQTGSVVEVRNIPNSRTAKDHKLLQLLETTEQETQLAVVRNEVDHVADGIHPGLFWESGDKLNYHPHIRWATDGTDGLFDVIFIPASQKIAIPEYPLKEDRQRDIHDLARTPVFKNEVKIPEELIQAWRENLAKVLPAYMIPDSFVALKRFPLTPNAKIDRKALPKPVAKKESEIWNKRAVLTENEQLITDIWSEILGIPHLQPSDDFFQLGGHSLLAVKVMVTIEKRTGKRLPIATLFNYPTIEKLAGQLSDDNPVKKWDVLVPIKTTGSKTPVFLIHGGGLNILLFKSITDHFSDDQPVYGLQALGLNHETEIPATIEGIAKRYINDMLEVNPSGPYSIAGYSLGGFIAFEIARQLKEMGREIRFLGIMDTYAGNHSEASDKLNPTVEKIKRQFHKIPFFTKSFLTSPKEAFEYQLKYAQKILRRIQTTELFIPKDTFTEYEVAIYKKYSDALDAYILTPTDLKMTLFRVKKRVYYMDDPVYLGWDKFALAGVNIQEVPGDHETFLYPPNNVQFAGIMQKALDSDGTYGKSR